MHTRFRRLAKSGIPVLAALLCVVTAAACGGPAGSQSQGAGHKQTIVVWQFWSGFAAGLQPLQKKLDAEFEAKYPQYVVDDVPISFTQMGTKLTAAIAAGTGPNVVSVFPGVAGAAYRNGLIPLQSYITASDRKNWRLLNEAAGPGGTVYSIPWSEYGYFIYYNKKLFAKAGLNPNVTPTTWQQFIQDCQTLKSHGITPLSGGFKDGYEWEWWAYPLLDQLMSPAVTKKWLEYNYPITSSVFQEAWSDIRALAPYFAKDAFGLTLYNDAYNNFYASKAAMVLDAPLVSNVVAAQKALGTANFGVFPVPRLPGSQYPPFVDAGPNSGWGITKWTTDTTGAWDYIKWMEGAQAQDLMWSLGHIIPNNVQSATPTSDPAIQTILNAVKNPLDHTTYVGFPVSVLAINERYASEMITGRTTTASVLQMMEQLRLELRPKIVG
jgi:ABC-type glycerol-3-phosphate transport system substrate-binding protein